ncbi:AraC family transcriptional regulator [Actinomycetospora sp. NBRC 106375]|uniref:AraC-like ligand-binding domain-containing protein n=1 Tax=Actinomycetospora sp. NBRC 106375 TaxID=3032207 RepID=UPI0024A1F605|nr:helix-turn-helix domain-containing protein [Actinomycetospora sp. NBRC 106375]GLZ49680.1 AraC family transcriptional regulator [Actinomycetospora sp. NBRC 106375]
MPSSLRFADVPVRDRVEVLHETVWTHVVPVEMTLPAPADVDVELRVAQAGALNVSSARTSPIAMERTSALVRRDHVPQVFLAVQVAGTTVVEQDGRQALLRPGDMSFYDSTRPYRIENRGRSEVHYVRIPRETLGLPGRRLDPMVARRIDATGNPLAGAVGSFFTALATSDALDHPDAARLVAEPGIELVRALLAVHVDAVERAPLERSLVVRVEQYVRDHLRERDLTPQRIAAAHHVSLRHLYAVLAAADVSLHDTIRDQRLAAARRELRDPRHDHQAVATVGRHWGFVDPSHFGRAFKQAFGVTPAEWRRSAGR